VVVCKSRVVRVLILRLRSEELTAKASASDLDHATKENALLTVNGAIGRAGQHVVSRVVVEHRVDPELVPIPRHNMEAKAAVEKTNKSVHATRPHVQSMVGGPSGAGGVHVH